MHAERSLPVVSSHSGTATLWRHDSEVITCRISRCCRSLARVSSSREEPLPFGAANRGLVGGEVCVEPSCASGVLSGRMIGCVSVIAGWILLQTPLLQTPVHVQAMPPREQPQHRKHPAPFPRSGGADLLDLSGWPTLSRVCPRFDGGAAASWEIVSSEATSFKKPP